MRRGRWSWLAVAVLLAAACDRTPREPVVVDLAAGGVAVAAGRPVPLVIDLGADGVRRIVQRPGESLEFFVRAPAAGALTFGLDPATPRDAFAVSIGVGSLEPAPADVGAADGGRFEASLAAAEGTIVRIVFVNRGVAPLAWAEPRVVGTAAARSALLPAELRRVVRPTNVVLVLVDALRADHLSLLGYHRATTPVLERLAAAHGIVFEQAYAPGPSTPNSIPPLFTSRPASSLGINFSALRARGYRTLAEALDLGGFRGAAFVGNPLLLEVFGYGRGFGTYAIVASDRGPPHLATAPTLVGRALEYLSVNRDASSFVYVHLMDTHTPFEPVPPYRDRFAGTGGPKPPLPARTLEGVDPPPPAPEVDVPRLVAGGLTADQADPDRYDEAIAMVDAELGRLVAGIAELGLGERTVVAVTADHGEALGLEDDGRRLHGHALYQELVHVPLVLLVPWSTGGRRVVDVVSLVDLAPTLLDLAGVPIPASFLGRSLFAAPPPLDPPAALFERLEAQWTDTQVLGFREFGVAEWGLREGPWKVLLDRERVRLFDVVADPKETRDVAAAHPDVVGALSQRLGRTSPALHGVPAPVLDPSAAGPQLEEALRALGYVR